MNQQLWQQAQNLFEQSLMLDEFLRSNYITSSTIGKPELRQLLETMMLAEKDESFMQTQPVVEVSENIADEQVQVFGHYSIIRKVAVGGMGRIYKAKSNTSDIDVFVALKLIRKELLSDQIALRFENEKAVLGKLSHHHIAALIDAGVVDEKPYIATEWIDGQAINEYVKDNELSINQLLNLFLQACEAVSYAHSQLVIHRDLKPANILVDSNKQVKLLDFGIAKLIENADGQVTQTQVFTPDYAAPEQINGLACTTATDIYALGVLLFELLVGEKRFGLNQLSVAEKIQAIAQPKTVFASQAMHLNQRSGAQKVKGALDTIINKAMHPDPVRRYSTVYELINDIKQFQQHRPINALGDSWVYRSQMFFKRNPWSSLMGLLLLVSLGVGQLYSDLQKQQAIQAQQLAQNEAEKSHQMLKFFMTILETASPLSGGSTQISVQQMFEDGAERFNLDAINDQAVKAEIAGQIAEIYGELSDHNLKIKYNEKALAYYQSDLQLHASKYLYHQLNIAHAYRDQDQYLLALELLTKAYEQVKNFKVSQSLLAEVMINFGQFYTQLGQTTEALNYLEQAEQLAQTINDVESLGKVKYYQYLILQYKLPAEESEQYLLQAQTYFEQAYSSTHPDLLNVRNSLGIKYKDQGQYRKASDLYTLLHTEYSQLYGVKNYDHLTNHANVRFALGDFEMAALLTKESLQVIEENKIEAGFSAMAATVVLARSLTELGRYAEAEKLWLKALSYFKSRFDDSHAVMLSLRTYWLDFLIKSGRIEDNLDDLNGLLELAQKQMNESYGTQRKYVNTLITLATYHWVHKNYQLGLNHLYTAQAIMQEISLKQGWVYWFIEAGIIKLNKNLELQTYASESTEPLAQLFMLLPAEHWYHNLFDTD